MRRHLAAALGVLFATPACTFSPLSLAECGEACDESSALEITGPSRIAIDACVPYTVTYAPRSTTTLTLTLEGTLALFQGPACAAPLGTSISVASSAGSATLFGHASNAGSYTLAVRDDLGARAQLSVTAIDPSEPPARLALSGPEQTRVGTCAPYSLSVLGDSGAPARLSSALDVSLAVSGPAAVHTLAVCAGTTTAIRMFSSQEVVYLQATDAGPVTLTAAAPPLQQASLSIDAVAGPPRNFSFRPIVTTVEGSPGACLPIHVVLEDDNGNELLDPGLAFQVTTEDSGTVYANDSCTTQRAAFLGAPTTFYFADWSVETTALTVTAPGVQSATQSIVIDVLPASRLVIAGPDYVTAGTCSMYEVNTLDASFVEVPVTNDLDVTLTTSSGLEAFSDRDCQTPASSVVVGQGNSFATFYLVGDQSVNNATISVAAASFSGDARAIGIAYDPDRLVLEADGGRIGDCIPIRVSMRNEADQEIASPDDTLVTLGNWGNGTLYVDADCGSPGTEVLLAAGTSAVVVSYVAAHPEMVGVDASATGFASANLIFPVAPALPITLEATNLTLSAPATWREVAVDPSDGQTLVAVDRLGRAYRTTNATQDWTHLCVVPEFERTLDGLGVLRIGPDGTAYVDNFVMVYRLDANNGGACTAITSSNENIYSYWFSASMDIGADNTLYKFSHPTLTLHKSTNHGGTWSLVWTDLSSTAWMGFMAVSPHDPLVILIDRAFAGTGAGLFRTDDGAAFSFVTNVGFDDTVNRIRFDPVHEGWVYKPGRFSQDNGLTWTPDTRYDMTYAWAMDETGAGYRFASNSPLATIERAPDMTNPDWAALPFGDLGVSIDTLTAIDLSVARGTIAAQVGGYVYLSTDNGATFTRVAGPPPPRNSFANVVAANETRLYGVLWPGHVLISDDGGDNWRIPTSTAVIPWSHWLVGHVTPADPNTVWYRPEDYNSTYDTHVIGTRDGWGTTIEGNFGPYGWACVAALSPTEPMVFYGLGFNVSRTLNAGTTTAESLNGSTPVVWSPSPIGWVHPHNVDIVWYSGSPNSGGISSSLWEVTMATGQAVTTDISSRTGMQPSGIDFFQRGGEDYLRVVSRDGRLAESTDLAATFYAIGDGIAGNACSARLLVSSPVDRNVVATACVNGPAHLSLDVGQTWWPVESTCATTQLALVDEALFVSCSNAEVQSVAY